MSEYSNFWNDILEAAEGEAIEGIKIISLIDYWKYGEPDKRDVGVKEVLNKLLTPEQAKPLLNYSYYTGYGSMDCHDIEFWTATRVFYIHEYDGSTKIQSVERNPS